MTKNKKEPAGVGARVIHSVFETAERRLSSVEGPGMPSDDRQGQARDELNTLTNEFDQYSEGWFRVLAAPLSPEPLDDSFSQRQHWRQRTLHEARQLRFMVTLWAGVDTREPCLPQAADAMRRMAAFLTEKATEVDRLHRENL